ncbi:MAG: hypothetical protein IV088_10590 [Hydrogenophaga sp.]|uniref:hypothetical protein n=1 Tax=Hydrogenophaga sp. TaxID=1904254 RepID=UPI0025C0862B|nr:hypothetical protein [Hydrogenophaga sp.]MBT9551286.1 hypothetical protein [Hydrogenophaga sp.]
MKPCCRWMVLLGLAYALAGCREQEILSPHHTSMERHGEQQSAVVCGLNTTPLLTITGRTPYEANSVLAGFRTVYVPGAPPIACNRQQSANVQGVMMFIGTLDAGMPVNATTALLDILSFRPAAPVQVTEARPLSTGVTGTWSGATRSTCRFKIKSFPRSGWVPGPESYGRSWITTSELTDDGNDRFSVPFTTHPVINVTDEFRAGVIEGNRVFLRVTIEADDIGVAAGATNHCYGQFTARLRLLAPD